MSKELFVLRKQLSSFALDALALSEHPHEKIDAYLWGLLPDNEGTLNRLRRDHHVSPRNALRLALRNPFIDPVGR